MSAATLVLGGGGIRSSRKLSLVELGILVVATALVSLGLFAITPLQGRADFLVFTLALYAVVQTAASFVVEGRRQALDRLMTLGVRLALLLALVPLIAVAVFVVVRGVKGISLDFLSHSMAGIGPNDLGGGAYHAIVGTLEQVAIASVIAVPLGLLTSIYVTEYGRGKLSTAIRFVMDVMTGVPSVVTGLFVFAFWVIVFGPSGFAASLALAILMLPVVMRSAEEMIRLVPDDLREASYALGIPKWKTILSIVLPTASAGITTGVMLAVARVTGETAPVLLTAQLTDSINNSPFTGKQSGLGAYIFQQAGSSAANHENRAYAAALTLIVIVLALYAGARLLTRRNSLVS